MKSLPLKCLTVFIILLFSFEISKGQLSNTNKESCEIILCQCAKNESTEKNCVNLELKGNGSRPTNNCEKVETVVVTCPVSNSTEVKLINLLNLQKIVFSKKDYSILSHCFHLISETPHISPLVNILRI